MFMKIGKERPPPKINSSVNAMKVQKKKKNCQIQLFQKSGSLT